MDCARPEVLEAMVQKVVFKEMQERGIIGAAVGVVKGGRQPLNIVRAFGYEDIEADDLISCSSTWFDLGACAQLLTALSALRALQTAGIELDTDINTILPPHLKINNNGHSPVLLHHLFTHTSGLVRGLEDATPKLSESGGLPQSLVPPPYDRMEPLPGSTDDSPVTSYLTMFENTCKYTPGSIYRPAPLNVVLLAAVVEVLTGTEYTIYAREEILTKALSINCVRPDHVQLKTYLSTSASARSPVSLSPYLAPAPNRLTPLCGLVLTAEGANKMISALLPAPTAPGGHGEALATGPLLSTPFVRSMYSGHVLPGQDVKVGYGGLMAHSSTGTQPAGCAGVFFMGCHAASLAAGVDRVGEGSLSSCCQLGLVVAPESSFSMVVLANTTDPSKGPQPSPPPVWANLGAAGFAIKVIEQVVGAFRPSSMPRQIAKGWLVNLTQPQPRQDVVANLICFPYGGTAATAVYEAWPSMMPDYIKVRAVQAPGNGSRVHEPPICDLGVMSSIAADVVASSVGREAPLILFGHGVGALWAFEVARRLESWYDITPMHLFVSGCAPPDTWKQATDGATYSPWLTPTATPGKADHRPKVHQMQQQGDQVVALANSVRTPRQWRTDRAALLEYLPALLADVEAEESYMFSPALPSTNSRLSSAVKAEARKCPLNCPITTYHGGEDPTLFPELLEGWAKMTSGSVQSSIFPGDHYFLEDKRGGSAMLASIAQTVGRQLTVHASWLAARPVRPSKPVAKQSGAFR